MRAMRRHMLSGMLISDWLEAQKKRLVGIVASNFSCCLCLHNTRGTLVEVGCGTRTRALQLSPEMLAYHSMFKLLLPAET